MVRNFKGVVKVADVQAEFDNLLNAINDKIDTYNSSLNIEDVDYNNGGPDLAAYGYTLSVGGLKAVLDAYDGAILGANVLRISNNQYIVSEGLYIKDRTVTKLPSRVLSGTGNTVYFNSSNNTYSFTQGGGTVEVPYTLPVISGSDTSSLGTLGDFNTFTAEIVNPEGSVHAYNSFKNNAADYVELNSRWALEGDMIGLNFTLTFPAYINKFTSLQMTLKVKGDKSFNGHILHGALGVGGAEIALEKTFEISDDELEHAFTYTVNAQEFANNWYFQFGSSKITFQIFTIAPLPTDFGNIKMSIGNIELTGVVRQQVPGGNILISPVNRNRISRLCNKPNAVNENIPDYKMTIESKGSGYTINGNQYLSNSDKGQFFSGSAGRNCAINLLGTQVAYHQWHGDRTDSYHEPINFLFVPKGIPNPYGGLSGETRFAMQKVFNYILKRPER